MTKPIRIDAGLHKIAKIHAAKEQRTLKGLTEEGLADLLGVKIGDIDVVD